MLARLRQLAISAGICVLAFIGRIPRRRQVGAAAGALLFFFLPRRRRIAEINVRLTLPQLPDAARLQIVRRHFAALGGWLLDNLWALSASRRALCEYVRVEGEPPPPGSLLLVPHFIGLEVAVQRLALSMPAGSVGFYYKPLHSGFWDKVVNRLRCRFSAVGFSTESPRYSMRAALRHCQRGGVLCYLPDIDPRARKSTVYVPFMAVQEAATTTGLSRLAKAARAPVVPVLICRQSGSARGSDAGYILNILPPLENFPSGDDTADAERMNRCIGEWVEKMPENYFWLHRRFKTAASGKSGFYD